MVVHKESLSILESLPWDGSYKRRLAEMVPYFQDATKKSLASIGVDPEEYWEVKSFSVLAKKIRACYPWFDPVVNEEGVLVDVRPWPMEQRYSSLGYEPCDEFNQSIIDQANDIMKQLGGSRRLRRKKATMKLSYV